MPLFGIVIADSTFICVVAAVVVVGGGGGGCDYHCRYRYTCIAFTHILYFHCIEYLGYKPGC